MPLPLIAYAAAAGLGAYLLLRPKPVITVREPGTPAPPLPISPPPPAGQPTPPGMFTLPSGNITKAIDFGTVGFVAASDPENTNNPQFSIPGAILVGDCFTVDIGTAGLKVEGVPSGNVLFKCIDPMDGTTGIKGVPVDPRLPSGLDEMTLPKAAITGGGPC